MGFFRAKAGDFSIQKPRLPPLHSCARARHRKPSAKKNLRRVELYKNPKTIGGFPETQHRKKTHSISPLNLPKFAGEGGYRRGRRFMESTWSSGVFSEQRSEFGIGSGSVWQSIRGPEGHLLKKTWGGKQKQVRVKMGLRGQIKRPLPREKGPRGPCDPMAARISRQNPGNGGDQPTAQEALPWGSGDHSPEGRARTSRSAHFG